MDQVICYYEILKMKLHHSGVLCLYTHSLHFTKNLIWCHGPCYFPGTVLGKGKRLLLSVIAFLAFPEVQSPVSCTRLPPGVQRAGWLLLPQQGSCKHLRM